MKKIRFIKTVALSLTLVTMLALVACAVSLGKIEANLEENSKLGLLNYEKLEGEEIDEICLKS